MPKTRVEMSSFLEEQKFSSPCNSSQEYYNKMIDAILSALDGPSKEERAEMILFYDDLTEEGRNKAKKYSNDWIWKGWLEIANKIRDLIQGHAAKEPTDADVCLSEEKNKCRS